MPKPKLQAAVRLANLRWDKTTPAQRAEVGQKLLAARRTKAQERQAAASTTQET